jgi:hypothetical protein
MTTICQICEKLGIEAHPDTSPGVCDRCYAKGWRTGSEMMGALGADPELDVDEHGNVGLKRQRVGEPRPLAKPEPSGEA